MRGKKEEDEENEGMNDDLGGGEGKAIMREGKDDEKRKGK